MRTAVALTILFAAPAAAQDADPAAVVRKAVDAAGGAAALAKLPAAKVVASGSLFSGGTAVPVLAEQVYHLPGRSRLVVKLVTKEQPVEVLNVVNGAKVKYTINGAPVPVTDVAAKELQDAAAALEIGHLTPLLDPKRFTLKAEKAGKGADPDRVGVVATAKGGDEFRLGFDKTTGHLVRLSRKAFDPSTGKTVEQEQVFSAFKPFGTPALVRPTKVVVFKDGAKFLELTTDALTPLETVDAKEFATE